MGELHPPEPPLADNLVTLRRFTLDDVPAVTAACQDPEISRWTASVPYPYGEGHARWWISQHGAFWSSGDKTPLAITSVADGRLLGSIGFASIDWGSRSSEVGYWVAATARNQGVATRALNLLCGWAFEWLEQAEVIAHIMVGNVASERVAEKAGFEFTNVVPEYHHAAAPDRTFEVKRWVRLRRLM